MTAAASECCAVSAGTPARVHLAIQQAGDKSPQSFLQGLLRHRKPFHQRRHGAFSRTLRPGGIAGAQHCIISTPARTCWLPRRQVTPCAQIRVVPSCSGDTRLDSSCQSCASCHRSRVNPEGSAWLRSGFQTNQWSCNCSARALRLALPCKLFLASGRLLHNRSVPNKHFPLFQVDQMCKWKVKLLQSGLGISPPSLPEFLKRLGPKPHEAFGHSFAAEGFDDALVFTFPGLCKSANQCLLPQVYQFTLTCTNLHASPQTDTTTLSKKSCFLTNKTQ